MSSAVSTQHVASYNFRAVAKSLPPLDADFRRRRRVLTLAKADAISLVTIGPIGFVAAVWLNDHPGILLTATIAAAGVVELMGHSQLVDGQVRGLKKLTTSQLLVCAGFLAYCLHGIFFTEAAKLLSLLPSASRDALDQLWPDPDDQAALLQVVLRAVYAIVALVAVLYQGSLARFYARSHAAFNRPPVGP
jgi:hypothetical protein